MTDTSLSAPRSTLALFTGASLRGLRACLGAVDRLLGPMRLIYLFAWERSRQ